MNRTTFLIALALGLSTMVYTMVIAKAHTNDGGLYVRSYTPLSGGGDSTSTDSVRTQFVVLDNGSDQLDSLPEEVIIESIEIEPLIYGRASDYRYMREVIDLERVLAEQLDSIAQMQFVVEGEPKPDSTVTEVDDPMINTPD